MASFIFGERAGVHIVDLEKTQIQLKEALEFVQSLGREGKVLLLVGSKKAAAPVVKKYASEIGQPYVDRRWLGGTITNWAELSKLVRRYLDLKGQHERGELSKYTKKEQLDFTKDIERMRQLVEGISTLTRLPDALFVVDIKHEETAVREASQKKIPMVALCDTNVNPDAIAYIIPGNDDAIKSIELITKLVAEAYKEGVEEAKVAKAEVKEEEKKEEAVTSISNSPKV